MSVEAYAGEKENKDIDHSPLGQFHALRLYSAVHQLKRVENILEKNDGESTTVEYTYPTPDGQKHSVVIDVTPQLRRGLTSIVLFERKALVEEGFESLAEHIAPKSKEPTPPAKNFTGE